MFVIVDSILLINVCYYMNVEEIKKIIIDQKGEIPYIFKNEKIGG
jgi:hypothetical protein